MRFLHASVCLLTLTAHSLFPQNKKGDPAQIGNRDVGKGVNIYSIEREMALGKQLAQEVQRQAKVVDDPLISEYINRVGQSLVRNSDAKVPFTFQLIEGDSPNAFALPGGYIFVYTALIKIADEEDELAAALAHEIAHVAARHMTRQATKSEIVNMATIPVGVILGGGLAGIAARQGANLGVPAAFLHFTRKDEAEADFLGLQYLYAAGYDPNGAISIFEKLESLQKSKPGTVARIFSTHPMDADRIQKAESEINRILPARDEYVINTSEYRGMRERLITRDMRKRSISTTQGREDDPDRPTIRRRDLIE
uniref:Peptidase M48, Ste24p n=1 Tax=Solibacter usitatus (strain Ellin6076) TaxID=234267 RepID=Q020G5_SOLUE